MRILGIDPGYATIGYGVIDYNKNRFSVAGYGAITTPAGIPFERRLSDIYNDMNELIKKYSPDEMSIEKLYFNTNTTTAIDVAEARGVILLAAYSGGVKIAEYTPLTSDTFLHEHTWGLVQLLHGGDYQHTPCHLHCPGEL